MRTVIDLTLPIRRTWRYPFESKLVKDFAQGDGFQITEFGLRSHWYTHIDAPKHFLADGATLDDFSLDLLAGKALILDFSNIGPNEAITAEMLANAATGYDNYKILLIRTDWPKKISWETTDFWDTAPYVSEEGAKWIRDYNPDVVGFDFPQDYDIRLLRFKNESECYQPCHEFILKSGILMIEYMTNLWSIPSSTCDIVALPLKLEQADGAQIRVVALP